MNVVQTTVTKTAEEKTEQGLYQIEYTTVNGLLSHVQVTIRVAQQEGPENGRIIGTMSLDNGYVSCNLPGEGNLTPYFEDFDLFLKSIRESIKE